MKTEFFKNVSLLRTMTVLLLILLNVGCDQVSKETAREKLTYGEQIEVMDDYFILVKVENKGAFLGMGSAWANGLREVLLVLIPALVMLFFTAQLILGHYTSALQVLGLTSIIGGGIGNLYDRIVFQSVTDFMNMGIGDLRTGIFNMADVSIMVGIGLVVFSLLREKKTQSAKAATTPESLAVDSETTEPSLENLENPSPAEDSDETPK